MLSVDTRMFSWMFSNFFPPVFWFILFYIIVLYAGSHCICITSVSPDLYSIIFPWWFPYKLSGDVGLESSSAVVFSFNNFLFTYENNFGILFLIFQIMFLLKLSNGNIDEFTPYISYYILIIIQSKYMNLKYTMCFDIFIHGEFVKSSLLSYWSLHSLDLSSCYLCRTRSKSLTVFKYKNHYY